MPVIEQGLGDDADGVGEVDDPRIWCRAPADLLGDVEHHRDGPERLGEATRAGRLLADDPEPERQRLVDQTGGLTADP